MAISTKPFHPLDAENNRRYKVTAKAAPKIAWHKTETTGPHDWDGYIRIEEDSDCTFSVTLDDNGYIELDGKKVVEITGSNSSTSKTGAAIRLKKGFHYVKLHHENLAVPETIAPYPNAEEFVPKLNGEDLKLWEIDAPKNLMTKEDAKALLADYNVYGFASNNSTSDVYAAIGGWLDDYHQQGLDNYQYSCAIRLSIGLSRFGVSLKGIPGANNIGEGDNTVLGGKEHVIISADDMGAYLTQKIGVADYSAYEKYSTPQPGDIAVWHRPSDRSQGIVGHVGMGSQDNVFNEGGGDGEKYWLLYRATLEDPETSVFK